MPMNQPVHKLSDHGAGRGPAVGKTHTLSMCLFLLEHIFGPSEIKGLQCIIFQELTS